MEESVFTKIINGEIPCHKVYEDDRTLAFMDIHPQQPGQLVVVPKTQVNFVWDLESTEYQALMSAVQKVGQALRKAFPDKKRIGVMIEGLDVDNHAHVVVLPFDNPEEFHAVAPTDEPNHEALEQVAEKIRSVL